MAALKRVVREEVVDFEEMSLDDIFEVEWPTRNEYLQAFLDGEEPIKLKAVDGDTGNYVNWKVVFQNKEFNFGPKGKVVTPKIAIDLIYLYGKNGQYRGMDVRTGLTYSRLFSMPKSEREDWADRGVTLENFRDIYLIHYTDKLEELEEIEKKEREALRNGASPA